MQLWTDIVDPAELTAFARTSLEVQDDGPFGAIFPRHEQDEVVFPWRAGEILDDVAEYGDFDTEASIGGGGVTEEKYARLIPVSRKRQLSEQEQITNPARVQQLADDKTEAVVRAVVNRLNRARAEALVSGALALDENGVNLTVDFGRNTEQTNAAPASLWSATGADPIADLETWIAMVSDRADGVTPDTMLVSSRVATILGGVLGEAGYVTSTGPVIARNMVNEVLAAYGLPTLTVVDGRIAGSRLIPDNTIVLATSGGYSGNTVFGPTVEASDPRFGLAEGQRTGIVAGLYRADDPPLGWALAKAVAMPILTNPDATLSAVVL